MTAPAPVEVYNTIAGVFTREDRGASSFMYVRMFDTYIKWIYGARRTNAAGAQVFHNRGRRLEGAESGAIMVPALRVLGRGMRRRTRRASPVSMRLHIDCQ